MNAKRKPSLDFEINRATKQADEAKKRVELRDAACLGLWLRINPKVEEAPGSRTWVLQCRDRDGKPRRYKLGTYPTLGVKGARDAAAAMRVEVQQKGADPIALRRRERAVAVDAKAGIGTLTALLDEYENKAGKTLKSWTECRRRIESVFADQLTRPVERMALVDLQHSADTWPSAQSAAAAVRYIRPVLKWAAHRRRVPLEVTTISPPATVGRRKRVLSREELARVLRALTASERVYAKCMRFMLLTLARREEAATALWCDVDLDAGTWTIPITKNDEPHVVCLPPQALELLRSRLPVDKKNKPLKPPPDSPVFSTAPGGPLVNWDRETKAIAEASKTSGWHRHDLRRTGATMLGEHGEAPHIIEAALNHVAVHSQLASTYNRSRYRPEVERALAWLADEYDRLEAGESSAAALPAAA